MPKKIKAIPPSLPTITGEIRPATENQEKTETVVNEQVVVSTDKNATPLSSLDQINNFLQGNRTYICGFAGFVTVGLWIFKVIDDSVADKLLSLLGFGGLIALRASRK